MRSDRHAVTALLVALLGVVLLLGPASLAHAHSDLVSSDPKDGARLTSMPASVRLTFNEDIDPDFAQAVVADAQGVARPTTPSVKGAAMTVPMPEEVRTGEVEVRYRIVSADGHPIAGRIVFGVDTPTRTSTPAAAATPVTENSRAAADAVTPEEREESANTWMYALTGFAVLLVVAIGAGILVMSRRHH